jgi:hypothetical protein
MLKIKSTIKKELTETRSMDTYSNNVLRIEAMKNTKQIPGIKNTMR